MNRQEFLKLESKEQRLAQVDHIKYHWIVSRNGDRYTLCIPQLGIVCSEKNIEKAIQNIEEDKRSYLKQMIEADMEREIVFPEVKQDNRGFERGILKKVGGGILVFGFCLITAHQSAKIFGKTLNKQLDKSKVKIANIFSPPKEKKQKRLKRFKKQVEDLRPYLKLIKETLKEE